MTPEASYLKTVRDVYAEAHARIDSGLASPEQAAREALAVWKRDPIAVAAGTRSYCAPDQH